MQVRRIVGALALAIAVQPFIGFGAQAQLPFLNFFGFGRHRGDDVYIRQPACGPTFVAPVQQGVIMEQPAVILQSAPARVSTPVIYSQPAVLTQPVGTQTMIIRQQPAVITTPGLTRTTTTITTGSRCSD